MAGEVSTTSPRTRPNDRTSRGLGQVTDVLGRAEHVLIAGCGGGHDVFSGVPLWWHLRAAGIRVSFASMSFTERAAMPEAAMDPAGACFAVGPQATSIGEVYGSISFAELHLARWLEGQGVTDPVVWTMPSAGVEAIRSAYSWLVGHLGVDAVVLVDGGNDSLMGGWEHGLGSVAEDGVSMVAAASLAIPTKLLVCAGLGTDARHGVTLAETLQAVAELTARGAWRGVCSLTAGDPGVEAMREAIAASNAAQKATSTVANAVVAAADGRFGAIATGTAGGGDSVVWVNPLMSMYWAFDLDAVVERLAYASALEGTATIRDVIRNVISWRRAHPSSRKSAPRIPI